ncbi:hypothetical protein B0J17DRAFT_630844 [Rhizoctonia solani]|nr:hypothetical protein B0J17DRAFT_630844 [Rhizoctonia solani]
MEGSLDIEWHGRLKYVRIFRKLVLQSAVERVTIQRFPNLQSFARWHIFIELKRKWFGTPFLLELNTNAYRLTCGRTKRGPVSGEPQLILPGPQNRPHQVTVQRVVQVAADFRRNLYVTSQMSEQQFQCEWALWAVKLVMELGESEPIAANPTTLYEFRDQAVKEALASE